MIDIPGYRIIRALGRGGMASVHLALQESVQREVAIKVMAPTLLGDDSYGERFLREARIAAKLRHPHVVQVHDVGVSGPCHYMAMEYLAGGPVLRRDHAAGNLRHALRVTREIASALGYAHARGVIHRDIKPDNILLREDGAAVLTDFGIARAADNVRMTMAGSVMGTPSYMSPEQARGADLDGRSDLYSLGVVFYELLTGRVPYSAHDSLSVGIMHITEPVPRLPAELAWLQPVIDRALAKEPQARFQSGDEFAQVLLEIEQGLTPTPIRMAPVSHTPAAQTVAVAQPGEPRLGHMEHVSDDRHQRRRMAVAPATAGRGSWRWVYGALLALLLAVVAAVVFQDHLRGLLPPSQIQLALNEADAALAAGRVDSTPGQRGARELYAAVLVMDAENPQARDGLARIGKHWLEAARQALASGDGKAAADALQHAREAGVAAAEIDPMEQALRDASRADDALARWLEQAMAARTGGRLYGSDGSALALYRRVLEIDPDNAIAQAGVGDVLAAMLGEVRQLAQAGKFAPAASLIEEVSAIEPAHPDLPAARALLGEAQQSGQSEREAALLAADALFKRGRLTSPAGGNALDAYRAVLRADPSNSRAQQGVAQVGEAVLGQFNRAVADFDIERAEAALLAAAQAQVASQRLANARDRLDTARKRQQDLQAASAQAADPQRLRALLDEAKAALAAGQLLSPPGDSAYDKYRQVLSADPQNAEARAGLAEIPGEAKRRYEAALTAGQLAAARGFVDALEAQAASDPQLGQMKRKLAQAYIGFAEERLGAGEAQRASSAFDHARELDPGNTDLPRLQARIEQLSGG